MDWEARFKLEVCGRLRACREAVGLSRAEVSRQIKLKGGERSYANYENGRTIPWRHMEELARMFGTTYEWLVRGSEETPLDLRLAAIEQEMQELRRDLQAGPQAGNGNGEGAS